jgi:hypothetical protein
MDSLANRQNIAVLIGYHSKWWTTDKDEKPTDHAR